MTYARIFAFAAVLVAMLPRVALASVPAIDAAHRITVGDERLRVTTTFYNHLPTDTWTFATPLPPGTRVLTRGATLSLDPRDQSIVGLTLAEPEYPQTIELELPWTADDSLLELPLPLEPGWQRVEIEGDHRLIPNEGLALPLHTTGYYAPGDLHELQRLRIDAGMDRRHPAGATYLPGAAIIEAGGIPARLESGAARRLGLGVVAGGVFVAGLLVFVVVFRRSAAEVEVEEAEAYLESELRTLADVAEPP